MKIQERLLAYEQALETFEDSSWEKRWYPHPDAHVGMKIDRLHRKLEDNDELILHRFHPDTGEAAPHPHPMAVAAHVLGPGAYEVGFITNDVCHVRVMCNESFYYEMRTPEVAHFVLPRSGPIYTVALWTPFQESAEIPSTALVPMDSARVLPIVSGAFDRLW